MIKPRNEVDLRRLSSLKIGGIAESVYFPRSFSELVEVIHNLTESRLHFHLIGRGTNVIFSSERHSTPIVCTLKMRKHEFLNLSGECDCVFDEIISKIHTESNGSKLLFAECGALNSELIRLSISAGVGDITNLSGVPGTLGGALAMNAEGIMNIMEGNMWVAEVNYHNGQVIIKESTEYKYEYRYCSVQERIVGAALLRLFPKDSEAMRKQVHTLLSRRKATQPLNMPSPGSAFKNPKSDFAGRLLDVSGLKGVRVGDAAFSEKHANFIVNLGNATSDDVLRLMAHGKRVVWEKFAISLMPEVKFIGKFDEELLKLVIEEISN